MFKNLFSSRQEWRKENLVGFATIDFPKKPQLNKSSKGLTQIGYNGGAIFFVVDIEDLSNYGLDVKRNELNDLYNGIIIGFFENPEKKALVKKEFSVSGLTGIEIIYSTAPTDIPNLRYKRLLFFKDKIFSYEFWTTFADEEKTKGDREKYFNSFAITLDKSILRQYTTEQNGS
jgi:hypothetical protein